jgi:hypothetical protein
MSIYDKMKLGWIRPRILGPGVPERSYTFPAIETTPAAMILLPSSPRTPTGNEYWILENRNKSSSPRDFDKDIPDSGLAIWWVDEAGSMVALVDAREEGNRPNTFLYSASDSQVDALFKYQDGDSLTVHSISPKTGGGLRLFRGISPEGTEIRGAF